jgi:type IV secretion system protein TrbL
MTACSVPVVNAVCTVATSVAGSVGTSVVNELATAFASAQTEMLKILIGAWVYAPTPGLSSGGTVGFLQGSLSWYVSAAAVLGLLMAAGRLAWERRPAAAKVVAAGLVRTLLVVGAGVAAIGAASAASDAFSSWILNQAAGGVGTQALTTMGTLAATSIPAAGLVVILAVLSIIGMVIQVALLMVRSALLVVLAGVWPLAASVSMIEGGQAWFRKITGWLLAMLLYKPAAAIILAAAIQLTSGAGSGELATVEGIILIALAAVAMPAVMRFVVPFVAGVGGVSTAEVVGAGIAAATGAAMIAGTGGAAAAGGADASAGASGSRMAGSAVGGSGPGPEGGTGGSSPPPGGPNVGGGGTSPTPTPGDGSGGGADPPDVANGPGTAPEGHGGPRPSGPPGSAGGTGSAPAPAPAEDGGGTPGGSNPPGHAAAKGASAPAGERSGPQSPAADGSARGGAAPAPTGAGQENGAASRIGGAGRPMAVGAGLHQAATSTGRAGAEVVGDRADDADGVAAPGAGPQRS